MLDPACVPSPVRAVVVLFGCLALVVLAPAAEAPDVLTSRPLPPIPNIKPPAIGSEVRTGNSERRRIVLPDGSVVFLNRATAFTLDGERRLTLQRGEVLIQAHDGTSDLVVEASGRKVSGRGSTFMVRTARAGAAVSVTRGKVSVAGLEKALAGGQRLDADSSKPAADPRLLHLPDWTRELMAEAEPTLVPPSQHAGGSLIAVDPGGQEAKLSLRKFHIDVHIEGGFARTTIDQTYFNHLPSRLEGTFYFPLPPDASLSRLAMYVDGNLMEGGMVERDYGRDVYERIVTQQKDPALLEWLDGSTFKMRVFPLEGRQEKRILLSYTQRLAGLHGQLAYRFPVGHSLRTVDRLTLRALVKGGAAMTWSSSSHTLQSKTDGDDLLLTMEQKNAKLDRDVVLSLDEDTTGQTSLHLATVEQDGAKYLMVRYRPELPGEPNRQRRDWVFLVETSGDRDPLLMRTQIEVVRALLKEAEPGDTFALLAANTRTAALSDKSLFVTEANVARAIAFLEGRHLIGALDLGHALADTERFLKEGKNPYLVHVGSGIAAMGERRDDVLSKRPPDGTRYVGIGVGRRWARSLMKTTAERTGGLFTQINPDESIAWRSFELAASLNSGRLLGVRVTDKDGKVPLLPYATALAVGEEVVAVARVDAGQELPKAVMVRGTFNGRPFERELVIKNAETNAGYLPRTWAKLEIERLLAEDAAKHKEAIVALSKAMYVMTPFTSLLVLENEEMYEQYKVDRGRKDHWAPYPSPKKIAIVYEPLGGQEGDPKKGIKPSAQRVMDTIIVRSSPRFLAGSDSSGKVRTGGLNAEQVSGPNE
jgi:hypothetical protein